jgi:hypothetical protein
VEFGVKQRLVQFLRALLPDGEFWRMAATERYVQALAAAVQPLAELIEDLPRAIMPNNAGRAVLLQWWEAVRSPCVATPVDTEELRGKVVAALGAEPAHTPAGLQALLDAGLNFVELDESLPVSSVPGDVPMDIEPTGRILRIWYSQLIDSESIVRCVARGYAPAGDELLLVHPDALLLNVVGPNANQSALAWQFARGDSDLVVTKMLGNGTGTSSTVTTALDETGAATVATLMGISSGTNVAGDLLSWKMQRDIGGSPVDVMTTRRALLYQMAGKPPLPTFETLTGLTWTHLLVGSAIDAVSFATLARSGTADRNTVGDLANSDFGTRVLHCDQNTSDKFAATSSAFAELRPDRSAVIVFVYNVRAFTAGTFQHVLVKRTASGAASEGWEVIIATSQRLTLNVDDESGPTVAVQPSSLSNTAPGWHTGVITWNHVTGALVMATNIDSASPTSAVERPIGLFSGVRQLQVGVMSGAGCRRGRVVPTCPVAPGRRRMRSGERRQRSHVSAALDQAKRRQDAHVLAAGAVGASQRQGGARDHRPTGRAR